MRSLPAVAVDCGGLLQPDLRPLGRALADIHRALVHGNVLLGEGQSQFAVGRLGHGMGCARYISTCARAAGSLLQSMPPISEAPVG